MTSGPMSTRLAKVLLSHRTTPQGMTGISPAELLLKRSPRTRLDIIRRNTSERVEERQWQHKRNHDTRSKLRSLKLGDAVLVKNLGSGSRWLPGKITQVSGPVSFRVLLKDGRQQKCHLDHLRLRFLDEETEDDSLVSSSDTEESEFLVPESNATTQLPQFVAPPDSSGSTAAGPSTSSATNESSTEFKRRYPAHIRKPESTTNLELDCTLILFSWFSFKL